LIIHIPESSVPTDLNETQDLPFFTIVKRTIIWFKLFNISL